MCHCASEIIREAGPTRPDLFLGGEQLLPGGMQLLLHPVCLCCLQHCQPTIRNFQAEHVAHCQGRRCRAPCTAAIRCSLCSSWHSGVFMSTQTLHNDRKGRIRQTCSYTSLPPPEPD